MWTGHNSAACRLEAGVFNLRHLSRAVRCCHTRIQIKFLPLRMRVSLEKIAPRHSAHVSNGIVYKSQKINKSATLDPSLVWGEAVTTILPIRQDPTPIMYVRFYFALWYIASPEMPERREIHSGRIGPPAAAGPKRTALRWL
jgi:hypothetical protein